MIAYRPYSQCPNKHSSMPGDYPWEMIPLRENEIAPEGFIVCSEDEYSSLLESLSSQIDEYSKAIQREKDYQTMLSRADVKDSLIAKMGSENKERVRLGIWTEDQLTSLTQDDGLKLVLDDINSLSFELAIAKLSTIQNELITDEIKAGWIQDLQNNLFL